LFTSRLYLFTSRRAIKALQGFVSALKADLVEGGSDIASEEEETSAPHT
jgi:hypothetical protein